MRAPEEFVEGFRRFWAAPTLAGFDELLADDVTLVQPLAPVMRGLPAVRAGFARIFTWLPDLRGEVDRWSVAGEVLLIEFRLRATIGGRPFEWPVVDRFVLGADGKATSRVTYFDPLPLLGVALARPSGWLQLLRSGAATTLFRRSPGSAAP